MKPEAAQVPHLTDKLANAEVLRFCFAEWAPGRSRACQRDCITGGKCLLSRAELLSCKAVKKQKEAERVRSAEAQAWQQAEVALDAAKAGGYEC